MGNNAPREVSGELRLLPPPVGHLLRVADGRYSGTRTMVIITVHNKTEATPKVSIFMTGIYYDEWRKTPRRPSTPFSATKP